MADQGQKTEKPTPKKLHKAREEGQFPVAKEFVGAMQFLTAVLLLNAWGNEWFFDTQYEFRRLLARAFDLSMGVGDWTEILRHVLITAFIPLGIAGAALMGVTLATQLVTTGMGFSVKKLSPGFQRLNPMARLKELPGQNGMALVQASVLLTVMGLAIYVITRENLHAFLALPLASVYTGVARLSGSMEDLLWKMAGILLVFGTLDLLRQRRKFEKNLRMTKQEIRDEHKEAEGNPQIKSRIRRLQRDLLRRQMMKEIPTATALIVNPTHFAVAIRYQVESMASPVVVAKGKNYLALRIRQRAIEHNVPIVENPPLARGLYQAVEIGQEIPADFYRAVAEILAYIYKLMGHRRPV